MMKSATTFALALALTAGMATAALASNTTASNTGNATASQATAAAETKTKEQCEQMPTAERAECMKHVKDHQAAAQPQTGTAQQADHGHSH